MHTTEDTSFVVCDLCLETSCTTLVVDQEAEFENPILSLARQPDYACSDTSHFETEVFTNEKIHIKSNHAILLLYVKDDVLGYW